MQLKVTGLLQYLCSKMKTKLIKNYNCLVFMEGIIYNADITPSTFTS